MDHSAIDPEDFQVVEPGYIYEVPEYRVVDGKGLERTNNTYRIRFVRGSKDADENVPRLEGMMPETLIAVCKHSFEEKNKLVPARETSIIVRYLEDALCWLQRRQYLRRKAGTQGTYKK